MAPVGRWQKGRDLNWYAKADDPDQPSGETADERRIRERREEIRRIKEAEEDALAKALGLPVTPRNGVGTGANGISVGEINKAIKDTEDGDEGIEEVGKSKGFGDFVGKVETGPERIFKEDQQGGLIDVGRSQKDSRSDRHHTRHRSRSRERSRRKHGHRHRSRSRSRERERERARDRDRDRDRHRRQTGEYHDDRHRRSRARDETDRRRSESPKAKERRYRDRSRSPHRDDTTRSQRSTYPERRMERMEKESTGLRTLRERSRSPRTSR